MGQQLLRQVYVLDYLHSGFEAVIAHRHRPEQDIFRDWSEKEFLSYVVIYREEELALLLGQFLLPALFKYVVPIETMLRRSGCNRASWRNSRWTISMLPTVALILIAKSSNLLTCTSRCFGRELSGRSQCSLRRRMRAAQYRGPSPIYQRTRVCVYSLDTGVIRSVSSDHSWVIWPMACPAACNFALARGPHSARVPGWTGVCNLSQPPILGPGFAGG